MRDDRLVQLIASGHAAYDQLLTGVGHPGTTERSHLVRLARLRFLAPDIVTAIVYGRQPVELTPRALLRAAELPLGWADQRQMLGFSEPSLALIALASAEFSTTNYRDLDSGHPEGLPRRRAF